MLKKYMAVILFFLVATTGFGDNQKTSTANLHFLPVHSIYKKIEKERSNIYMLLAYSVVYKDWQTHNSHPRRGHNIGAVLVNPQDKVVFWARNANDITGNGTQHAEVRLMQGYLRQTKRRNLSGYTIYTTLEPCAMCAGMLILQRIHLVVYGQTDPPFGKAVERLSLDSSKLENGYKPYPRTRHLRSIAASGTIRASLDRAYDQYVERTNNRSITRFLLTEKAREIYKTAMEKFLHYKVKYRANQIIYKQARLFYQNVSAHYVKLAA